MTQESLDDFRKKYKDTYCFLTLNGKEYLVHYADDNGGNNFYLHSPEFGEIIVDQNTLQSCLRPVFPKTGLYNLDGSAVEYTRLPERQWKRAPCASNTTLFPILKKLSITPPTNTKINLHTLEEIFKRKYPKSIDNALENLRYSTALNRNFAISQSITGKDSELLFWYRSQPIGLLNAITKEITIKYNHLYQETLDFLRKNETSWNLTPKTKP